MKKLTPSMLRKALKLFKRFAKSTKPYLKDKKQLGYLLSQALTMAKGRGGELWEDTQILVRLLKAWRSGAYNGVSSQSLAVMVAGILYVISPLDLIPDFVPVIGFVDDASVMAWLFESIGKELKNFRQWEKEAPSRLRNLKNSNNKTAASRNKRRRIKRAASRARKPRY